MSWRDRYRISAFILLIVQAGLLIIDWFYRNSNQKTESLLSLAAGSVFFALFFLTINFSKNNLLKLLPIFTLVAITTASVIWTNSVNTSYSTVGFTVLFIISFAYVGFVFPPGSATLFSIVPLIGLFLINNYTDNLINWQEIIVSIPVGILISETLSISTQYASKYKNADGRRKAIVHLENVLSAFRQPMTLEEASKEIADTTQKLFNVSRTVVILRKQSGDLISAASGKLDDQVPEKTDAKTMQLVVEAIGGKEPKIVPYKKQSMLVCPLPSAGSPAGAVVAYPISDHDPDFLITIAKLFSTQIGISIEHLFVIDQLKKDSSTDELTGMGNRKHANALLNSLKKGDALILLDLDGFKEVNDSLGHPAGDKVLLDLSNHLKNCLRDSDTSARLGGDEFLVVARKAFADPKAVALRILKGWDTPDRSTTMSAGVALHDSNATPEQTYNRADKALYEAKASGKNQAILWRGKQLEQAS